MVEAKDFFHQFFPDATEILTPKSRKRKRTKPKKTKWPRLEYLSLTTDLLGATSCQALLQAAAAAVERMPKLRTMVLSGQEEHEKFIYLTQGTRNIILKPSGLSLSADTLRCWQHLVAPDNNVYGLRIEELSEGASDDWARRYPGAISRRSATDTTLKQLERERQTLERGSFFR
jgi:hypothetical protein